MIFYSLPVLVLPRYSISIHNAPSLQVQYSKYSSSSLASIKSREDTCSHTVSTIFLANIAKRVVRPSVENRNISALWLNYFIVFVVTFLWLNRFLIWSSSIDPAICGVQLIVHILFKEILQMSISRILKLTKF